MGSMADAVSDSVTSRSTAPTSRIMEGALPAVFGAMVGTVGFGGPSYAAAHQQTTAARCPNDAGRRSSFGYRNQNHSG